MKKFFQKKYVRTGFAAVVASSVVMASSMVALADEATNTAMTTALTAVKTDALSALAIVAPIGIAIFGAFLVWKFGLKFFKGLAK